MDRDTALAGKHLLARWTVDYPAQWESHDTARSSLHLSLYDFPFNCFLSISNSLMFNLPISNTEIVNPFLVLKYCLHLTCKVFYSTDDSLYWQFLCHLVGSSSTFSCTSSSYLCTSIHIPCFGDFTLCPVFHCYLCIFKLLSFQV